MNLRVFSTNYESGSVMYDLNTGLCTINVIFQVFDEDVPNRWDGQCLVTFQIDDTTNTINSATKSRIQQYVLDTFGQSIATNRVRLLWV